jgi:hypothetical protein
MASPQQRHNRSSNTRTAELVDCASIVLRMHTNEAHYCKTLVRQASWLQPL